MIRGEKAGGAALTVRSRDWIALKAEKGNVLRFEMFVSKEIYTAFPNGIRFTLPSGAEIMM